MDFKQWPVPHNARLDKAIEPGQTLAIQGRLWEEIPKEGNNRIVINLSAGEGGHDPPSIPLHTSIRFDTKETVFNSKDNGEWGKEETKKNPFKAGEPFDLRIRPHGDKYEIMVDQKDFHQFHHRQPLGSVSHLYIDGPLLLTSVVWGGRYYSVPYEAGIQGGLGPGRRLFISGVPEKKGNGFHVNLLSANGDIALHVNPRFTEKKVIRNSQQGGEWGNEEKEGAFPFKKDIGFDMILQNESYAFQIYVDGERLCTFAHRMEPGSINGLQVGGEVELQAIQTM